MRSVATFLSLGVLATSALAKNFFDFGRDRKWSFKEIDEEAHAKRSTAARDTSSFRYLTDATSPYLVNSLPGFNFDIGEMYAGNIPITAGDNSRSLFFIYTPATSPSNDNITVWLNGGPGCSSLEGFLEENGPYVWYPGSSGPVANPYAWNKLTNMLWVEQPVGTGYATGKPTATNEETIAKDFANFFQNWQTTFGISNHKIQVSGESYAGRYVPYISAEFLNRKNKQYFDLNAALVYDPCIGAFTYTAEQAFTYPYVQAQNSILKIPQSTVNSLASAHQTCGYADYINKYFKFPAVGIQPVAPATSRSCDVFDTAINAATNANQCFNIYEITQTCPEPIDPLNGPGSGSSGTAYFQRSDVKTAIHAPTGVTWEECSSDAVFVGRGGPQGEGDTSLDPIQKVLPQVIQATNRVLVGNGDLDFIILTNGTLMSIQNMTWNGGLGFQTRPSTPITLKGDGGKSVGTQHYERGLMWVETAQSGHMQPEYQPKAAFAHLAWLLGVTDSITGL